MGGPRVLVVEDDRAIRRGLVDALKYHGYETLEAVDGDAGIKSALGAELDLMLLDLMMPGRSGFDTLKEIRKSRPNLPVIILTARGESDDKIKGLKLGADDYVVKPFHVQELIARVEAVLRRSPARTSPTRSLKLAGVSIDLEGGRATFCEGDSIDLSDRDVALLRYLAGQPGRTVGRPELLQQVWEIDPTNSDTRSVDMQVVRLREKLRDQADPAAIIRTIRGRGYRLIVSAETLEERGDSSIDDRSASRSRESARRRGSTR